METVKTKVEWQGIIRMLLSSFGAFLIGKTILGNTVDAVWWEAAIGAIMGIVSIVWSIFDKTLSIEATQGTLRQVVSFLGGFAVSAGWITSELLLGISGVITALIPVVQGFFARRKSNMVAQGIINTDKLKK